jgi:hypothetical protein
MSAPQRSFNVSKSGHVVLLSAKKYCTTEARIPLVTNVTSLRAIGLAHPCWKGSRSRFNAAFAAHPFNIQK